MSKKRTSLTLRLDQLEEKQQQDLNRWADSQKSIQGSLTNLIQHVLNAVGDVDIMDFTVQKELHTRFEKLFNDEVVLIEQKSIPVVSLPKDDLPPNELQEEVEVLPSQEDKPQEKEQQLPSNEPQKEVKVLPSKEDKPQEKEQPLPSNEPQKEVQDVEKAKDILALKEEQKAANDALSGLKLDDIMVADSFDGDWT